MEILFALSQFLLGKHSVLHRHFQSWWHLLLYFLTQRCFFLFDNLPQLLVLCFYFLGHLLAILALMSDDLLACVDGLLCCLETFNQEANHFVFALWLGHLFHYCKLAFQTLNLIIILLSQLIHFCFRYCLWVVGLVGRRLLAARDIRLLTTSQWPLRLVLFYPARLCPVRGGIWVLFITILIHFLFLKFDSII